MVDDALGGAGRSPARRPRRAGPLRPRQPARRGQDHDGELVAFFGSDWRRKRAEEEWPVLRFHAVREQHGLEEVRR